MGDHTNANQFLFVFGTDLALSHAIKISKVFIQEYIKSSNNENKYFAAREKSRTNDNDISIIVVEVLFVEIFVFVAQVNSVPILLLPPSPLSKLSRKLGHNTIRIFRHAGF